MSAPLSYAEPDDADFYVGASAVFAERRPTPHDPAPQSAHIAEAEAFNAAHGGELTISNNGAVAVVRLDAADLARPGAVEAVLKTSPLTRWMSAPAPLVTPESET